MNTNMRVVAVVIVCGLWSGASWATHKNITRYYSSQQAAIDACVADFQANCGDGGCSFSHCQWNSNAPTTFPFCKPWSPGSRERWWQWHTGGHTSYRRFRVCEACPAGYISDPVTGQCIKPKCLKDCPPEPCEEVGNPCDAATGNKYQAEVDYEGADGVPAVTRHYNSTLSEDFGFGVGWASFSAKSLVIDGTTVLIRQGNGRGELFTCSSAGPCSGDADTALLLTKDASGYTLTHLDGATESYDAAGALLSETDRAQRTTSYTYDTAGQLASVTGPHGHTVSLTYSGSRIASMTDPAGAVYAYSYDANGNLIRVDYPDGAAKLYHYEDGAFPNHLTGISYQEAGGAITRHSTYAYRSDGKAILTERAGGLERFDIQYDSDTQTTVTDAAGTPEVMTFAVNLGVKRLVAKVNQGDGKGLVQVFDARNNLTCKQNEEGRVTAYTYNSTNQKLSMTEGLAGDCANPLTTPDTRTTAYQYVSATLELPTLISAPSVAPGQARTTTIAYGDSAHPNLPTVITQSGYTPGGSAVARSVSLAYNSGGQVIGIDGPRTDVSDVTTLSYYDCTTGGACGQLQSITNALGQTTTYDTYDATGRLTQMTGPNGLITTYTYDARGRVSTVTQTPPTGLARTTSYTYNAAGNVTAVAFPDGVVLSYTYNAAQKLARVTNNLGNYIDYAYDLKGNRTGEATHDPDGTLVREMQTAYDLRNRVASINQGGSVTQQLHDAIGNLTRETDPNQVAAASGVNTTHTYDALNRLIETVNNLSGVTTYGYDAGDRLTQVQAPNSATTQYLYDDLGNLLQETSPDRGTTSYTYDAAGNVLTKTDARGITASYTYDALNRVTGIDYPGTAEDVVFTYDTGATCTAGVGRLCEVTDAAGATRYGYDAFGNVLVQERTELGVSYTTAYAYDAQNRVTSLTYPGGRVVTYGRDALGRIASVQATVNGSSQTLISGRTYRADGLFLTQTYGNGVSETRSYNTKGELTEQFLGSADTRVYAYDPNGNLTSLQSLPQVGGYTYDALDQLIQDEITSTPASSRSFIYDPNGNRTSDDDGSYVYAAATNRLTQTPASAITLDAAGNTLSDGTFTYSYNQDAHLYQVLSGSNVIATYTYNHHRQRTRKVAGTTTTIYHYDLAGNLIAETEANGALIRDYVWAESAPLAQITAGASEALTYLHADHLGTPRVGTDPSQAVAWRWEGEAFGDTLPTGSVTVNLRLAGQYFDGESGLFYNHHRYYDPRIGRYITSDTIGLEGGLNTYIYAFANPLRFSDRMGLAPFNPFDFPDCNPVDLGWHTEETRDVSKQVIFSMFAGLTWKNPRPGAGTSAPHPRGRLPSFPVKPVIVVDWYAVYQNWTRTTTTLTSKAYQLINLYCRREQECGPDLTWEMKGLKFYSDNPIVQKFISHAWERDEKFLFTAPTSWPNPF